MTSLINRIFSLCCFSEAQVASSSEQQLQCYACGLPKVHPENDILGSYGAGLGKKRWEEQERIWRLYPNLKSYVLYRNGLYMQQIHLSQKLQFWSLRRMDCESWIFETFVENFSPFKELFNSVYFPFSDLSIFSPNFVSSFKLKQTTVLMGNVLWRAQKIICWANTKGDF